MRKSVSPLRQHHRVLDIAKRVSATLGLDFFQGMVGHLAKSLKADCVYVAELTAAPTNRIKTLAVSRAGLQTDNFEQDLPGTGALQVLVDGSVAWGRNATRIFPLDTILESIKAEGFVGVRLLDSHGQVIGVLVLAAHARLQNAQVVRSILETFAPRAGAELERKRSQDALRQSEERYRAFISLSSDAMWRIEFEKPVPLNVPDDEQIEMIFRFGYVAECNGALCHLLGVGSADELTGRSFGSLFSREDARIREELRAAVRSGFSTSTVNTVLLDEGGKKVYRERTHTGIVENGKLHRIWGTTRDLTQLKKAEIAAEAAEHRFREVLQGIQLPALMLEKDGTIAFCNDILVALSHSREPLIGKNWLELIDPPEERTIWASLLAGQSDSIALDSHFESVIELCGAEARVIAWDTITLRNDDGEPSGLAAIGRDLTEQKDMDARLLQAEKLDSIGRLAAGIAHDFNNLLTLIMGNLNMAIDRLDPERDGFAHVVAAASATDQCAELTQQLLAIGRKQRLKPDLISLNDVIESEKPVVAGSAVFWPIWRPTPATPCPRGAR
jgi:PAS domain-containing protein